MKINEIIKEKRLEKGFTQEQLATRLGVSTPAVNKWEKAVSYPDITLLPSLARLLDTDLNTLLCFKEELSDQEIAEFVNELANFAREHTLDECFTLAQKKLQEYPNSDKLKLNITITLDGLGMFTNEKKTVAHINQIQAYYHDLKNSKDTQIAQYAATRIIYYEMEQAHYEKAEQLLKELPNELPFDRQQIHATIEKQKGNLDEASKLMEQKLLRLSNDLHACFSFLMGIAWQQGHINDCELLTEKFSSIAKALDLWTYTSYVLPFELAVKKKDADTSIDYLRNIMKASITPWQMQSSVLYQHIPNKTGTTQMGQTISKQILDNLVNPEYEEYAFIQQDERFQDIIKQYKEKGIDRFLEEL